MMSLPSIRVTKQLADFDSEIFNKSIEVSGISINSGNIQKGDLFVALSDILEPTPMDITR